MSNQPSSDSEHDEIFSMLPWYMNKTLELSQRGAVSHHLSHCDECQREVQFLASLNEHITSDAANHNHVNADVEKNLASVMNQIDSDVRQVDSISHWPSRLKQKLEMMFSFSIVRPGAQWGAAAMAGLLAAVLGIQLYYGQSNEDYSVLSSSDINDSSMRVSVEITSAAHQDQIQSVIQNELAKHEQRTDVSMNADGIFVIVFEEAVGVSELQDIMINLEKEVLIKRVELLP